MTFITARKNNLKNIHQTFIECDIDIERLFSRSFTLGVKLLDNHELQSGSILIDLGFDTTSMGLFKNLVMENSTIFPFGMNHITKDLSKILSLNLEETANIRNNIDFNLENNQKIFDENNYLKSTYFKDSKFRKISKNLIFDIIKSRLNEIIEILKKQLITSGFVSTPTTTLLVTGSGSNLINIEKYFSNFFELQIKKTNNDLELDKDIEKNFASCLGALKIIKDGWETEALPEIDSKNNKKIGFFAKIFGISK